MGRGPSGGAMRRAEIKKGMLSQRRRMNGGSSSWVASVLKSWRRVEKMMRPSFMRSTWYWRVGVRERKWKRNR